MTKRAVDFYSFAGREGQTRRRRLRGRRASTRGSRRWSSSPTRRGAISSVNRTGGVLDFTPPADGTYLIKVNDLTFQGGERHFYRLALQEVAADAPAPRQPQTQTVSSISWPPDGLAADRARRKETEPNNQPAEAQKITLPCDIAGSFFPAADVDTFEFTAKKGETWWVEVASERLGLTTDPFVLVQHVMQADGKAHRRGRTQRHRAAR